MIRIGLVDDDAMTRKMLGAALGAEGFDCIHCPNGAEALSRLPIERPDLILLDVNLPDIDGHEVCRRLKADPASRLIPVVMLTGEAREVEERVRGLELGADDYLFKPISPRLLIARIRAIIGSRGRR